MSNQEFMFLYDETEKTHTRFVSFVGESNRFDLAITTTDRFYGKVLVLNLQSNRFAIIGPDDLEEPGYLEHVYQISEAEADELKQFLHTLV
jgi:hypothetical protein